MDVKNLEKILLHKPVNVFFHSYEEIFELQYMCIYLHIATNVQTLCWSKTSPSFSGAHSSCISLSNNITNRHVHQDQYVENGFHLSQDLGRWCHILSEGTFFLLTVYIATSMRWVPFYRPSDIRKPVI